MSGRAVTYRRSPVAMSRSVGDEVLVCLPDWDEVDRISASGGAIWRGLAEPRTLAGLASTVAGVYGLKPAEVRADVRRFVGLLVERGLVERTTSAGGNGVRNGTRKEIR